MKAAILDFIRRRPTATFVELEQGVPGVSGELAMFQPAFPNIIVWPTLSKEAIEALAGLIQEGKIVMQLASQLSYFIDGKLPNLPIAKSIRSYKTPRWLPVCFSVKSETGITSSHS